MRMVKVLAVLLVPLLLTSFMAAAPAAHASKTYKLDMWSYYTSLVTTYYSNIINGKWYWAENLTYDLYDGYPGPGADVTSGYLIGHKWIVCAGVMDMNTFVDPEAGFGGYVITGNVNDPNFLGGKTGTFKLVFAGYGDSNLQLHGTFWISGGGGLKGISGLGTFLADDPVYGWSSPGSHPYVHYLGTVTFG